MIARYVIGGLAFLVDEELPGLTTEGFTDASIRVRFARSTTTRATDNCGVRHVSGPMGLTCTIDPESRECTLPSLYVNPAERAWQLRQMAPIVSAMFDRLVLHAGAVEIRGHVVAFVGQSGAGKSTLSRFLADRGHPFISDDLLPVRFQPEPSAPIEQRLLPLSAVCFLGRTDTRTVVVEPLAAVAALQRLVRHGFGEHNDAPSWGFQFDAYHRIAESTATFDLTIPDDLAALPLVEQTLIGFVDGYPEPGGAS